MEKLYKFNEWLKFFPTILFSFNVHIPKNLKSICQCFNDTPLAKILPYQNYNNMFHRLTVLAVKFSKGWRLITESEVVSLNKQFFASALS